MFGYFLWSDLHSKLFFLTLFLRCSSLVISGEIMGVGRNLLFKGVVMELKNH